MPTLSGVQEKFARANEHLKRLETDTHAFLKAEPYEFVPEREGDYALVRVKVKREIPLSLAVTLGDVFYNLRSALDHLTYALAELNGKPPRGTEFPIFKDKGKFFRTGPGGGLYKIRGLKPEHRTAIQALQPYKAGRDAIVQPLWVLHELANADKHRTLHMAGGIMEEFGLQFDYTDVALGEPELFAGRLIDGAVVGRVFILQTGTDPKMQVKPRALFNVTYDEAGLFEGRQVPTFLELRDAVGDVIARFKSAFA